MARQSTTDSNAKKPTASGRAERHQGTSPLVGAGSLALLGIPAGCWFFCVAVRRTLASHRLTFL